MNVDDRVLVAAPFLSKVQNCYAKMHVLCIMQFYISQIYMYIPLVCILNDACIGTAVIYDVNLCAIATQYDYA